MNKFSIAAAVLVGMIIIAGVWFAPAPRATSSEQAVQAAPGSPVEESQPPGADAADAGPVAQQQVSAEAADADEPRRGHHGHGHSFNVLNFVNQMAQQQAAEEIEARVDAFFALPESERTAALDERIDEMEARHKAIQASRPRQREIARRAVERLSPEQQARHAEYQTLLKNRRLERGLPASRTRFIPEANGESEDEASPQDAVPADAGVGQP